MAWNTTRRLFAWWTLEDRPMIRTIPRLPGIIPDERREAVASGRPTGTMGAMLGVTDRQRSPLAGEAVARGGVCQADGVAASPCGSAWR